VVGAARDLAKTKRATAEVRAQAATRGGLELVELDLASLQSVRACADALLADGRPFDAVIANAGVMRTPLGRTADGFEIQFGTNHLGSELRPYALRPDDCLWPLQDGQHLICGGIRPAPSRARRAGGRAAPGWNLTELGRHMQPGELEATPGVRPYALDPEHAKALWAKSEELVGERF